MDVFVFYAAATASWSIVQGSLLFFGPTVIATLLKHEFTNPTPLETYLCRTLGLTLLTLGLLCLILTGSVPLSASMRARPSSPSVTGGKSKENPYLVPTLWITVLYHAATTALMYSRTMTMGNAFYAGTTISGFLCVVGAWCGLFATSGGVIARETILDDQGSRRTSGYPFKNAVREEAKKK